MDKKKLIKRFIVKKMFLLLAMMLLPMHASAIQVGEEFESDGIRYKVVSLNDSYITKGDVVVVSSPLFNQEEITLNVVGGFNVIGIEEEAFSGNVYLKSVRTGKNVKYIGARAFQYCPNLSNISFATGLEEIREQAFRGCSKLNIPGQNFPYGLKIIGKEAFLQCNMDLLLFINCETIGERAFAGTNLDNIIIGPDVKSIYVNAFSFCDKLQTAILECSVIGDGMFDSCYNLWGIELKDNVSQIGVNAFKNCISLEVILISNKIERIGSCAFLGCISLKSLKFGDKMNYIDEGAFFGCINLHTVILSNNTLSIGSFAFGGCTSLSNIELGENLETIGEGAFQECTNLGTISIPDEVTFLGPNIFKDCGKLTSITIGAKVERLNSTMFEGCVSLDSLTITDGNSPIELDKNLLDESPLKYFYMGRNFKEGSKLSQKKLEKLEIGDLVTTLGYDAFFNCTNLKTIIIGSGVDYFYDPFPSCPNVSEISISNNNKFFDSRDQCNAVIKKQTNELVYGCQNTTIPKSVVKIGAIAFYDCINLQSIDIPEGITEIGIGAFEGCTRLSSIIFPNSISSIGKSAFSGCEQLESVIMSNKVSSIGEHAFMNCSKLNSIVIPNTIIEIGEKCFSGCNSLESVHIDTETCGDWFARLPSIKKVTLGENVKVIKIDAFVLCSGLESIEIPDGVNEICSNAFWGCSSMTSLSLGKNVSEIGYKAFANCSSLTDVYSYASKPVDGIYSAIFDGSNIDNAILHVPYGSVNEYKQTRPWKDFKEIVAITDGVQLYNLSYFVDGVLYKTYDLEAGTPITPEPDPVKEGYTFSGWNGLPEVMPDHDVTVTGTFTINKYKLTFMVGENVYETRTLEYGSTIIVPEMPELTGYTFSWGEVPATMPARDLTIVGEYQPNLYNVTYLIDGQFFAIHKVAYGSTITPPEAPERAGSTFTWGEYPKTMPAHDITIEGTYTVGINLVQGNQDNQNTEIYTVGGKKVNRMQRGVNIIRRGSKVVKVAR